MNKVIVSFVLSSFFVLGMKAQVMFDDFESNQFGWTETSQRGGVAIIKNGVMLLEAEDGDIRNEINQKEKPDYVCVTCYAPFDYNKPFTLSVDVIVDKVSKSRAFGLLLDYEDDANFIVFILRKEKAELLRISQGKIVGMKSEDLKLGRGKDVGLQIEVEYALNELVFRVNGVKTLSYRRRVSGGEFILGTSGIGFYAGQEQKVSFDNLKIVQ